MAPAFHIFAAAFIVLFMRDLCDVLKKPMNFTILALGYEEP